MLMKYWTPAVLLLGIALLAAEARLNSRREGPATEGLPSAGNVVFSAAVVLFFLLSLFPSYYYSVKPYDGSLWLRNFDAQYWYVAGKCWLAGISPYDAKEFGRMWVDVLGAPSLPKYGVAFVYPPTLLLVGIPISTLSWDGACTAMRLLSWTSFLGTCLCALTMTCESAGMRWRGHHLLLCLGLGGLMLAVPQTIYQGQTSLIVVFGVMLAFYAWRKNHGALLLAGLVLASMKPQISLLPLLYILVADRRNMVAVFSLGTVVTWLAILVVTPLESLPAHVRESIRIHMEEQGWNQLNRYDSLPSLAGATDYGPAALYLGCLVGAAAAVYFGFRSRVEAAVPAGSPVLARTFLLCALSVALMPLHRYDTVIYLPLLISLLGLASLGHRMLLAGGLLAHSYVWDKRLLIALAVPLKGGSVQEAMSFVNSNYWAFASQCASVLSGVVFLLAVFVLRKQARAAARDTV